MHGGGSFPHTPAKEYRVHEGSIGGDFKGFVLVHQAAQALNKIICDEFIGAGLHVLPIQASGGVIAKRSRIVRWSVGIFKQALKHNLLPVTYGDVALDLAQGCSIISGEEIIRYLSGKLEVDRVILGSDVEGIYTQDPKKSPNGQKISLVTPRNVHEVLGVAEGSTGIDVTGGMGLKVRALLAIVKSDHRVECEIVNVMRPRVLESLLRGERGVGTVVRYK